MTYRKMAIMSLTALVAVLSIDPRPAKPAAPAPQPSAAQIEAAVAYAEQQSQLVNGKRR
jgi:hypothetical protein